MASKLGQAIQEAIRQEMLNAFIISPRFTDYQIADFTDTGAFEGLDKILEEAIDAENKKEFDQLRNEDKKIEDSIKRVESKISEAQSAVSDPKGFVGDKILDVLNDIPIAKSAIRMIPIIGAAITAPEIINKLVQILIAPGGPLDRRFKLILENYEQQFIDRLEQKRRQIGESQVIISQHNGFGNHKGRLTTNTLDQVKATGTSNIGLNEIQIGMR